VERAYEEAFAEIDEILKIMPVDLLSRIPVQFRRLISENRAINYKIDIKEPIEEKVLKEETIAILGLIYRDFLASPEEREELQAKDAEALRKIEEEMQEQYDVGNIFQKRKSKNNAENDDVSNDLILYKEQGFLKKLFNLIKGIFSKNKF